MDHREPSSQAEGQWWLDPAIAQLAFGTRAREQQATETWFGDERLAIDLNDPEQRALGEFELLELIGEGGMGLVYRARQNRLQREVAVKLLSAGPWASEEFIARFQEEARHAAQLQHPDIVAIHEMGELEGLVYYAMQLVRGESLAQHMQRCGGRLSSHRAASVLRIVAEAVDYAHSLGVLHLDLKPANILLDEEGNPRIADFGLARRLDTDDDALTNEHIAGTPSYMAPEQARIGEAPLTRASDVWGLGAILYDMLCGQPPFEAADASSTLELLRKGVVRKPSKIVPMSADLEAICLKCLAKAPEDRYPSARALADDLGRFLEGREVSVRPLNQAQKLWRWAWREPVLAALTATVVLALLAGMIATSLQWRRAQDNAAAANQLLWEGRREAALRLEQAGEGWQALAQLHQNSKEQAHAGRDGGDQLDQLRIGLLLGQGATLIDTIAIADANPLAVALSEDGSRLAIALNDQSVRWYDSATLDELGRLDLRGRISSGGQTRSIVLLRFAGNDHLRATLDWYGNYVSPTDGDTWLLDLQRRIVVEPPAEFSHFSDAAYDRDGRIALLRSRDRTVQLWRADPWTSVSAPVLAPGSGALPWMIAASGRHALALDDGMRTVHLYDLPELSRRDSWQFSREAGLSAWATSPDGTHAALGDAEGRVLLVELATGVTRTLSSSLGRQITWLSFCEDGVWIAAGNIDGRVRLLSVDSGDSLVSGTMEHDFVVRRVGVSRAHRLLVVAGDGRTALWRVPDSAGSIALSPIRIGMPPAMHDQAGPYAIDWSLNSGLLASAGVDGQVRLWRLSASTTAEVMLPPQVPETVHFDGKRLVDMEWNRLRVVSLDGAVASPWLELAQPPGYAELVGDGRTLVATVGRQLHIYDVPSLRPRFAAIDLPETPQRLLVGRDGRYALLSFVTRHDTGFGDRLHLYDLTIGQRLPGDVVLPGPHVMMAFSPAGDRIVAVGPDDAATTVLETQPLRILADYPHDPFNPVVGADFSRNGRDLLLVSRAMDPRLGTDEWLTWNPVTDAIGERHTTGRARPYGILALENSVFLPGEIDHLVYDDAGMRRIPRPQTPSESTMGAFAASPDRRLVALALRRSVSIYTADGAQIGSPLRIDAPAMDGIAEVAFSSDGQHLLARSNWRAMHWPVAAQAPFDEREALLSWLSTDKSIPHQLHIPSLQQRISARARDPGVWPGRHDRLPPTIAGHALLDRMPIPARMPGTPEVLLDLTRQYSVGPDSVRNSHATIRPFLRPYPAGVQRMGGVDFDIRGMAEVTADGLAHCLETPDGMPITAIRALLVPTVRSREDEPRTVAELVFHYRDGGQALVPIRTTREVQGFGDNDHRVPLVFSLKAPRAAMGIASARLAGPRLVNPEPERPVRCIDLRTTGDPMQILAVTVEP